MLGLLFLWGCSDCEECETEVSAPRTSFVFINQTSLNNLNPQVETIEATLEQLASEASTFSAQLTTLDSLLDSLTARITREEIEISQDSLDQINSTIEQLNGELTANSEQQALLNTDKSSLESTISTIESGAVLIDTIVNVATEEGLVFTDSASTFLLPLDPNFNEITYRFSIASQRYEVSLSYDLTQTLDARRKVRILAENIQYDSLTSTFDSVNIVSTESNNPHDATTVQCSF